MSLTTNYLGLALKNPIVASSSPLSHTVEGIRKLEDAGASAVVMYSLFEEQITFDSLYVDHYLRSNTNSHAEALSYFPEMDMYNVWPDEYLNVIRRAKESCEVPIIGSLNGVSSHGRSSLTTCMPKVRSATAIFSVSMSMRLRGWPLRMRRHSAPGAARASRPRRISADADDQAMRPMIAPVVQVASIPTAIERKPSARIS